MGSKMLYTQSYPENSKGMMTHFVAPGLIFYLGTSFSKACGYQLGWQPIWPSNEIFTTWKPEDAACAMWQWYFDSLPFISGSSLWCVFSATGGIQNRPSGHALGITTSSEGTRPNGATFWGLQLLQIFQLAMTAQHTKTHLKIHRILWTQIYVACAFQLTSHDWVIPKLEWLTRPRTLWIDLKYPDSTKHTWNRLRQTGGLKPFLRTNIKFKQKHGDDSLANKMFSFWIVLEGSKSAERWWSCSFYPYRIFSAVRQPSQATLTVILVF